jgi:hypothetical protein
MKFQSLLLPDVVTDEAPLVVDSGAVHINNKYRLRFMLYNFSCIARTVQNCYIFSILFQSFIERENNIKQKIS